MMQVPRDANGNLISMNRHEQNMFRALKKWDNLKAQILREGRYPSKTEKLEAQKFFGKPSLILEFRALGEIRAAAKRNWGWRPDRGRQYQAKINELKIFLRD